MGFRFLITLILLSGIGVLLLFACNQNPKETKNQTLEAEAKPVSNIDPNQCRSCHQEIVDAYLTTGKGRSFFKANQNKSIENWSWKAIYDPTIDLFYQPIRKDSLFFIKEFRLENKDTIHQRIEKIDFFIGSGNQTRSYLLEQNGYLYEHPLTWYTKKKIWDLSPGYEKGGNQSFDREVGTECMACHNSGFEGVPNSINRYKKFGNALSCESCHGDVSGHFDRMTRHSAKTDSQILRLAKLPVQAQLDVCRQCHLEGTKVRRENGKKGDYKPGDLFSDYYQVFISGSGETNFGFASHAERLQQSACFIGSKGQLTCVTCHDPHQSIPGNSDTYFNQKCMNCHGKEGHSKACSGLKNMEITAESASKCINCHLQKSGTKDIPHVSSTDHWIRKNPSKEKNNVQNPRFAPFAGKSFTPREKADALLAVSESKADSTTFRELKNFVQYLLPENKLKYNYLFHQEQNLKEDTQAFVNPKNPWTKFYWAEMKKRSSLPYLSTLQQACDAAPSMVEFQYRLALAKEEAGQNETYSNVLVLNPNHAKSLSNLGFRSLQARDYAKAEELLKRALIQSPNFTLAQENLARCYLEEGKFEDCRKILKRLIVKYPSEQRYRQALASIP